MIFAASSYVANAMGRKFVEPPGLDLGETLADSTPLSPLIFVLSPGVDPTDSLRKLANERDMGDRFYTVALGQGQVCNSVYLAMCMLTRSGLWADVQSVCQSTHPYPLVYADAQIGADQQPAQNWPTSATWEILSTPWR